MNQRPKVSSYSCKVNQVHNWQDIAPKNQPRAGQMLGDCTARDALLSCNRVNS